MRLGLFGGSFDPVHHGHLRLAACCREQSVLEEVWLIPAAVQPHKPGGPVASDADRVAMLRLATQGVPGTEVSTLEVDRGGVSYTVDTLRAVRESRPEAELFILMGADTLRDFPNWREPKEILRQATPLVVCRAGEPEPDFTLLAELTDADRVAEIERNRVEMAPTPISSSELRKRLYKGERCEDSLPAAVADYIVEKQLYR